MNENRLTQSPRHLIKVELMVEPGEITAKELHKILMRPAYAPGDEPTPTCEIPCIGDIIHLSDGRHAGDVAGVKVTDYYTER